MRLRSPLSSVPAVRADGQAADTDFQLDSWLRALRDLGDDRGWQQPGIGKIRVDRALNRACRVVGMVTLCTPNGFGDLMLNLKDPSGTIDASVHKKVLSNENLSKILSVGSVIFLKQVAVLRPSKTVCYLNVTQNNVEKVLQKDSVSPCKQVVSSISDRQSQQPGQGDNIMEQEDGAETSDGMTTILNNISRTQESRMVELLADNGGSEKAVNSSILRANKDTHVVQNHQKKLLKQMDSSSQIQNLPGFNTSQQLKQGGSIAKYGISSETQSSTEDIMRKLMDGQTMTPSSKEITVAERSRHNHGTSYASMYADARCNSEKPQEIGLQKMVEGHTYEHVSHRNRDEHHQQNLSGNTRCSQPILGESSIMCPRTDCTQVSCTGNLRRLSDNEWMQSSRKKQKSRAILSDGNGASMNSNSNTVSMDRETKHSIENSLNIGLDDITDGFHGDHSSTRKFEHQQKDLLAASAGTLQPTQEDCSISATSGTLLSHHKVVSVAPVAEWTDEQLSELFADY